MHFVRLAMLAALAGLAAGCESRDPAAEAALRTEMEADLKLVAELKGPQVITAGEMPRVDVHIVNTSPTATHRVVGTVSDVGGPLQAARVRWSATVDRGGGQWEPVTERRNLGFCGNGIAEAAARWPKDGVTLPPGGRLAVGASQTGDFQRAGRVRLVARYTYSADLTTANPELKNELKFLKGLPPFQLTAAPVEFQLTRPLDLRVRVKGRLKADRPVPIADVLDVTMVNQSAWPIEWDAGLGLGLRDDNCDCGYRDVPVRPDAAPPVKRTLAPGETISLLDAQPFNYACRGPGRVTLRAFYWLSAPFPGRQIVSEPVEVEVEP